MRKKKPYVLLIPTLMMEELEKNYQSHKINSRFKRENFYYLISHITVQQSIYKDNEFVFVNLKKLKLVTVSNIDRYLKLLVELGLVVADKHQVGVKSKWYKLNEKVCYGIKRLEIKTNSRLHVSLNKSNRRKKAHNNRLAPHLKIMRNEFIKLDFDYQGAEEWILNNATDENKIIYLTALERIKDTRTRFFSRNNTNQRLDTNLTIMKSDLRQFMTGDYVSIDLSNSQPFLLGILINSIINSKDTLCCYLSNESIVQTFGVKRIKKSLNCHQNQEKAKLVTLNSYLDSTKNGSLYDDFINVFDGELQRKEVKDLFFKVLFSKNVADGFAPYRKEKVKFSNVHPLVGTIVKALKVDDNKTLPIYLQKLESYLFIDCIAKRLVDVGIIPLTVHDSVIIKREHVQKALAIMKEVFFNEVGAVPSFKVEGITI